MSPLTVSQEQVMLSQPINDTRAWTAASTDAASAWYYPLPQVCLAVFDQVRRQAPQPAPAVQLAESDRAAVAVALLPVRAALETGRGFAIIEPPREPFSAADAQLLYWLV